MLLKGAGGQYLIIHKDIVRYNGETRGTRHYINKEKSMRSICNRLEELLSLPEHMNSHPVFSGVCVARSLVFCAMLCRSLFVLFHLAIVLYVLLRFTLLITPLVSSNFSYTNTSHFCHTAGESSASSQIGHDWSVRNIYIRNSNKNQ